MARSFFFVGHETIGAYVACHLAERGWEQVDDAAVADVCLSYCTSATSLEEAYFGEQGFVKNARPGTALIDLSPSTPSFARELSAIATVSDLNPVEAPLAIVNPICDDALAPANIRCYLGGESDGVETALPIVEALASEVVQTGGFGSAQLAKAAHTVQASARVMSAVEADALRRVSKVQGLIADSVSDAFPLLGATERSIVEASEAGVYEGAYTVEMLMADVAAAMTAADDVELILPQLESVFHILEVVAVIGGSDMTPAVLSLVYRDEAASAEVGLDWTCAENLFSMDGDYEGHDHGGHHHDHSHHHGDGFIDYGDPDDYDYDDYDGRGGGFGDFGGFADAYRGYSSN